MFGTFVYIEQLVDSTQVSTYVFIIPFVRDQLAPELNILVRNVDKRQKYCGPLNSRLSRYRSVCEKLNSGVPSSKNVSAKTKTSTLSIKKTRMFYFRIMNSKEKNNGCRLNYITFEWVTAITYFCIHILCIYLNFITQASFLEINNNSIYSNSIGNFQKYDI